METERRERNVRRLNTEQPRTNTFHVSEEFVYSNGVQRIRPDVIFLINGIPVLLVETKAATRLEGITEALEQVRRYQREGPELLAMLQLFTVTHLVQFYYGATWRSGRKDLFNWREEQELSLIHI